MQFVVPVTRATFTVVFTDSGETLRFLVGSLDPADTHTGVVNRLQNLGYLDPYSPATSFDNGAIAAALSAFKVSQSSQQANSNGSALSSARATLPRPSMHDGTDFPLYGDPPLDGQSANDRSPENDSPAAQLLDACTCRLLSDAHGC